MAVSKSLLNVLLWICVFKLQGNAETVKLQGTLKDFLLPKYERYLTEFSPKEKPIFSCVQPVPKWNKKTNHYRTAIGNDFKEAGGKPNFCARYFLMITPVTGGGDVFIFDCETGKPTVYSPKLAALNPMMKLESCALVINPPEPEFTVSDFTTTDGFKPEPVYGPPRLYRFDGKKIIELEDKIWPK
jgi:hypothetical protein